MTGARDDRGSMPMAMLLTVVGVGLCALLGSVVNGTLRSTRSDVQRVQALAAAQAGLDVAMARILGARDAAGLLVVAALPQADLAGATGTEGDGAYQATVRYYTTDPHGHDDAWLAANGTATASAATRYAVIAATGTDGRGGTPRTLTATYAFPASGSAGAAGGPIHLPATTADPDRCIAAQQATPTAGGILLVSACVAGAATQSFVYRPDLTLALTPATRAGGLCLDGGAAPAVGAAVTLQPCATPVPAQQRWQFTGTWNFAGAGGLCLNNDAGLLELGSACGGTPDGVQTWVPAAGVGVGAAGPGAGQLVNAEEWARCLMINQAEAPPWSFLKVHACAQETDLTWVGWKERWNLPPTGTGPIWLNDPSNGTFCLTAPAAGVTPPLVTMEACVPTAVQPAARLWTVRGPAGTWAESYRIEDTTGRCLASSTLPFAWYANKAVVAACDDSLIQKWNANSQAYRSRLRDVGEK